MFGRCAALLVAMGAAGLLLYIERDRFLAAEPAETDLAVAAFRACLDQETAPIEKMLADGMIDDDRATLFRSRAEARCRAQNPQ
jgi:hypothetical protein